VRRQRLARHYFECLAGDDLLTPSACARDSPGHSWNMFTVLLPLQALTQQPQGVQWTRCTGKASAPVSV